MTFFFDENLSPGLVRGMRAFGEDVTHLLEHFPAGTADDAFLPVVGDRGWIHVTRDIRQRRRPAEVEAYRRHRLGVFFVGGKQLDRCDLIQQIVRNWRTMKQLAADTPRPFRFRIPARGRIERIPG